MKRIISNLGFLGIAVAVVMPLSGRASGVDVKLRDRVVPKHSVVRLGDVAEIVSADRQQARQLAAVPLMPAPAPETERYLQRREVADMIAASGIEMANIQFEGASRVAVSGRGLVQQATFDEPASEPVERSANLHAAILAGEKVQAATPLNDEQASAIKGKLQQVVGDYVKSKTGKSSVGRIEITLTDRQLAQVGASLKPPVVNGGSEPWMGRQKFLVSFATAAGQGQVPLFADISEPAGPVVVAVRPVGRGSVVTAADLEVRMMEPTVKTTGRRAIFESVDKIIGMEARQALQEGEVVFADQLQSPVLVKRGDMIAVTSQTSGIRVKTSARALQDGSTGELIQVESLESKQHYNARVTGVREATVMAATRVVPPENDGQSQTARRISPTQ